MSYQEDILGKGWAFPPQFEKQAATPVMLSGEEDVRNSIYVIIHTKLGERVLRNEFGSIIHELVFEPLNANMKTYMADALRTALTENEPRITVEKIELVQPNPHEGLVEINIAYQLIQTNETKNIVVPFYTTEDTNILP